MIRIAIISDMHFGKDGRNSEFRLQTDTNGNIDNESSLVDGAIELCQKFNVEFLFILGDLTSIGDGAEFYHAEKIIKRIAEEANISEKKIIWCIGNHDNDWSIAELAEAPKYIEKMKYTNELIDIVRQKYDNIAASVAVHNISFQPEFKECGPSPMTGLYEDDRMVLFVLNSSTKCVRKMDIDRGNISEEQMNWLETKLIEYKGTKKWKIVLMHHHPYSYPFSLPGVDFSKLENSGEFLELIGKYGVNLAINGHRHHPKCKTVMESEWANEITFICSGSFSVDSQYRPCEIPNTFHIVELEDSVKELRLFTYEYSTGAGWIKVKKNCPETPLDYCMNLGRSFTSSQVLEDLENVMKNVKEKREVILWEELPKSWKFKSSVELEEILNSSEWANKYDFRITLDEYIVILEKRG